MSDAVSDDDGLLLRGLDGSNPLAFLAAVGTLRILTLAWPKCEVAMGWKPYRSSWCPFLVTRNSDHLSSEEEVVSALADTLTTDFDSHPCHVWQKVLTGTLLDRRAVAEEALLGGRCGVSEWLGGIGINTWSDENTDTQLRTTRQDYHVGNLRSVTGRTKPSHLHRTLFQYWDYADPLANQSLHLDPSEDRRHAYQWNRPTSDPDRFRRGNMLGANRLAIEAIPLILTVPTQGGLVTTGFRGRRVTNTLWRWPIWRPPVRVALLGAILSLEDIQVDPPDPTHLKARGIACIYQTQRILVQKTPNFSPAQGVMT